MDALLGALLGATFTALLTYLRDKQRDRRDDELRRLERAEAAALRFNDERHLAYADLIQAARRAANAGRDAMHFAAEWQRTTGFLKERAWAMFNDAHDSAKQAGDDIDAALAHLDLIGGAEVRAAGDKLRTAVAKLASASFTSDGDDLEQLSAELRDSIATARDEVIAIARRDLQLALPADGQTS